MDKPQFDKPLFGFVENAERFNSRASMIGIIAIVIFEAVSHANTHTHTHAHARNTCTCT